MRNLGGVSSRLAQPAFGDRCQKFDLVASRGAWRDGFTLVELLVTISILSILAALLLPALSRGKAAAHKAVCLSNLRQVGIALQTYAADNEDRIPFGPEAPPFTHPARLYTSTGAPTSLISTDHGAPVGLGLMIRDQLSREPRVLFCPGADQPLNADAELANTGTRQAQSSYFYRHAGNTALFDGPGAPGDGAGPRLHQLGKNRVGRPIRALAIDTMFLSPPGLESFNVVSRTHHRRQSAQILFAAGHVVSGDNRDGEFTVDVQIYSQLRHSYDKILGVLERADEEF